jgi:hypothetical protein
VKKLPYFAITLIYIAILPILLVDAFRSANTIGNYLFISSRTIAISAIAILILLRIFSSQTIHPLLGKFNTYIILPLSLASGVILTLLEHFTHSNFVYSLTRLQFTQIFYIGIFSLAIFLIGKSNEWYKQYNREIIFCASLVLLSIASVIYLFPNDVFAELSKEDHLIEYLQVFMLLLGAFWAGRCAYLFYKSRNFIHCTIFFLSAVGLFFIAGDEISWGQRIFGVETPESFKAINTQEEITVHNLESFAGFVSYFYMSIGLYGGLMWILQKRIPRLQKTPFLYYIPPAYCAVFYLSSFFYNFVAYIWTKHTIGLWAEPAELMLYTGIMLTTLMLFLTIQRENNILNAKPLAR